MVGVPPAVHGAVERVSMRGESVRRRIRAVLLAATFWSAITLPFLYLPLLVTGLETRGQAVVFLTLVGLNAVALLLGHSYSAR